MITRRTLFRAGAGALGFSRFGRLAQLNAAVSPVTPNYKAMVCIFLFGGNDANNLLVPMSTAGYQKYSTARGGTLALAANTLSPIAAANGTAYGLHPRLAPLQPLYLQKKLALAANVGMLVKPITKAQYQQGQAAVPSNLFSHSDQQQQWQTAPSSTVRTGWGGRAADIMMALNAPSSFPTGVSAAGNSLFLTAQNNPATVTNGGLGLDGSDGSPLANARDAAFQQILTMTGGLTLVQSAGDVVGRGIEVGKVLNATLQGSAITTVFPDTSIGQQLAQVARILKVRQQLGMNRQIFFASHGGYDTHTNQLPSQDGLYAELAAAMAAFYTATQELQLEDQVVTFTESEFGRTFQPSSGAGTDHAWGSHHVVMGGAVKGGDIYGTFPSLDLGGPDDISTRGVWLPSSSLDQYGAAIASWFGVNDSALPTVFPNLVNFPAGKMNFI